MIAVDTRGHGRSPRGRGTFTLERFADDLKGFLDRRGLRRIILLGFSDGGNIALIFALKYPGYVDRLILNGANLNPFGMKRPCWRMWRGSMWELWGSSGCRKAASQIRGKMQMAAGKMRTEKHFSKENEKQNGQEGLNKQQRRSCQKEKIPENKENDRKANIHKKELLSLMLYEPGSALNFSIV